MSYDMEESIIPSLAIFYDVDLYDMILKYTK